MKRINYIIALLMCSVVALSSCLEDEDLLDTLDTGALVNGPSPVTFTLGTSTSVEYEFDIQQNNDGDVASVSVFKQISVGEDTSNEVAVGDFSTFPASVNLDVAALLNGLQIDGAAVVIGDVSAGDELTFRYEINMSDGRTLNPLPSSSTTVDFVED